MQDAREAWAGLRETQRAALDEHEVSSPDVPDLPRAGTRPARWRGLWMNRATRRQFLYENRRNWRQR